MAATPTRRSRAARAADQAGQDQPNLKAVPESQPKPETPKSETPKAKPTATIDLGARQVTYWFPAIVLADGTRVECKHSKYGHESEASAKKCARSLAAQHGAVAA